MSTEKEAEKRAEKREAVTLKKTVIQGDTEKKAGDKINVTAKQKTRLTESGHI